jgi:hypothetical protein
MVRANRALLLALLWVSAGVACTEEPPSGGSGADGAPPNNPTDTGTIEDSGGALPDSGLPPAPDASGDLDGAIDQDGAPPGDTGTSNADASVIIFDGEPPPPPDGGALLVMPQVATIELGTRQRFTVDAPMGSTPVWSVNNVAGGDVSTGTIAADPNDPLAAIYTAPLDPPQLPVEHEIRAALSNGAEGTAMIALLYPAPVVTRFSPTSLIAGSATTTLTLIGSGFVSTTRFELDGVGVMQRRRSFYSTDVELPTALLVNAGERRLMIRNPTPGGGAVTIILPVIFDRDLVGPGVDARVPDLFDRAMTGNDPARRPAVTYPQDLSSAPLDFPAPTVSWSLPATLDICRVRYRSAAVLLDQYVNPARRQAFENPNVTVAADIWRGIIQSTPQIHQLAIEVACADLVANGGTLSLAGNEIFVSPPVRYVITRDSAGGRIVYFSGLIEGLWRIDIGSLTTTGEPWIGPSTAFRLNSGSCVGCHSFNRDGARMSFGTAIASGWEIGTVGVANEVPSIAFTPGAGAPAVWTSMHPTGNWVLATDEVNQLRLLDANTGAQIAAIPTGGDTSLAVWAPDGASFAYVRGVTGAEGTDLGDGRIYTMTFSITNNVPTFGPAVLIAGPDVTGGTAYYPSFSPDGRWIAFCRAPSGTSYNNRGGELWLVRSNGMGAPVRMAGANMGANLANSWPRWAPTYSADRYWLIFSSQRAYPPLIGTGPQQLWVTRVDTSAFPADPSSPAIWLSGQEAFTGNLTAEWAAAQ